jgi:hypothetical protein
MSIPIRIHNEHTKDIRVVMHSATGPLVSYRIPPNSTSPSMDMSAVHGIMISDDEGEVATDPCLANDLRCDVTDPEESESSPINIASEPEEPPVRKPKSR